MTDLSHFASAATMHGTALKGTKLQAVQAGRLALMGLVAILLAGLGRPVRYDFPVPLRQVMNTSRAPRFSWARARSLAVHLIHHHLLSVEMVMSRGKSAAYGAALYDVDFGSWNFNWDRIIRCWPAVECPSSAVCGEVPRGVQNAPACHRSVAMKLTCRPQERSIAIVAESDLRNVSAKVSALDGAQEGRHAR